MKCQVCKRHQAVAVAFNEETLKWEACCPCSGSIRYFWYESRDALNKRAKILREVLGSSYDREAIQSIVNQVWGEK